MPRSGRAPKLCCLLLIGTAVGAGFVELAAAEQSNCDVGKTAGDSGTAIQRWTVAGNELVICSYGIRPALVAKNTWQGSEFFVLLKRDSMSKVLFDFDAITEARYLAAPPDFTFTEFTVAADDSTWTRRLPLVRHRVHLLPSGSQIRSTFLLAGRACTKAQLAEVFGQLNASKLSSEERLRLLYRIRDFAITQPGIALSQLYEARSAPWADGALSEELLRIIREVELARDLPHGSP